MERFARFQRIRPRGTQKKGGGGQGRARKKARGSREEGSAFHALRTHLRKKLSRVVHDAARFPARFSSSPPSKRAAGAALSRLVSRSACTCQAAERTANKYLRRAYVLDVNGRDLDPPSAPAVFARTYARIRTHTRAISASTCNRGSSRKPSDDGFVPLER